MFSSKNQQFWWSLMEDFAKHLSPLCSPNLTLTHVLGKNSMSNSFSPSSKGHDCWKKHNFIDTLERVFFFFFHMFLAENLMISTWWFGDRSISWLLPHELHVSSFVKQSRAGKMRRTRKCASNRFDLWRNAALWGEYSWVSENGRNSWDLQFVFQRISLYIYIYIFWCYPPLWLKDPFWRIPKVCSDFTKDIAYTVAVCCTGATNIGDPRHFLKLVG